MAKSKKKRLSNKDISKVAEEIFKANASLAALQGRFYGISKKVAGHTKTDISEGIIDELEDINAHLKKSSSELAKACAKIKEL
jgi:seryl-tRNA synthetase